MFRFNRGRTSEAIAYPMDTKTNFIGRLKRVFNLSIETGPFYQETGHDLLQ